MKAIAKKYAHVSGMLFFGRQFNFPIALEAALKMKEITYLFAEGHPSAELKHGIIALVRPELPSVFITPDDAVFSKNLNNIEQVRARKGPVIAVTSGSGARNTCNIADDIVSIPDGARLRQPDPDRHSAPASRLPSRGRARPRRRQAAQSREERDRRVEVIQRMPLSPVHCTFVIFPATTSVSKCQWPIRPASGLATT